jgi:hypothetical protein
MRYTGEARIRLTGDREAASQLISFARTILGRLMMRNEGTAKPLGVVMQQFVIPGASFRVGVSDGVPWLHIYVRPKSGDVEPRSTAEECHTGLFVQNSAYGLLADGDFRDFFLALNQLRLYESTVRVVRGSSVSRIPRQPWIGPVSLKRDQDETWNFLFGNEAFLRLAARDNICCFTQIDPVDPEILWGGMTGNCGLSDPGKRFWVGRDHDGRRVFFHHNLVEVFPANAYERNFTLSVRVTANPVFDWDAGVALGSFEIPLPALPWNAYDNGYFVCDVNASGTKVLLCGFGGVDYGTGRPAMYTERIIEVSFSLGPSSVASVLILKQWSPSGNISTGNTFQFSSTNLGGDASESFDLWVYRDTSDPTGEVTGYHATDVVLVPFGDPAPPSSALWLARVNNSHLGAVRERSAAVIGAYYAGNTDTVQYILWNVDRTWTYDQDNDFITQESLGITGSIIQTYCGDTQPCSTSGSITASVPEITFTGRVHTDIFISAGNHVVADFGYEEVRSVVEDARQITWEPTNQTSTSITSTGGARITANTHTVVATFTPPLAFFPARDSIPPLTNIRTRDAVIRQGPSNMVNQAVSNLPEFVPDYFDNELAYLPSHSWGWLYSYNRSTAFDRISFIDFHGGCKQFSICEYQAPVTGSPLLPMTVYRSQVVALGRDADTVQFFGHPSAYHVGPDSYRLSSVADISSVYGVDARWKITPLYELHNCASFNPITGQLAYGFNNPVAWQGEWRGWPWEGCGGAPTGYTPQPATSPNPPFGVAKLLDPVYVPDDATVEWVGTRLPNDASPGCPE